MAKGKRTTKAPPARAKKTRVKSESAPGDHVRMLAPKGAVTSFIRDVLWIKNETSNIGRELSSSSKQAANAGVNVPAARLAARKVALAQRDPAKARVLVEDEGIYLEYMEFDRLAPPGMFSPEETGQRSKKAEQADMEWPEEGQPEPELQDPPAMTPDVAGLVTH